MWIAIYIDFEKFKQGDGMNYKIWDATETKQKSIENLNKFLLIDNGGLQVSYDQYKDMKKEDKLYEFLIDIGLELEEDIPLIQNFNAFKNYYLPKLLKVDCVLENLIYDECEMGKVKKIS